MLLFFHKAEYAVASKEPLSKRYLTPVSARKFLSFFTFSVIVLFPDEKKISEYGTLLYAAPFRYREVLPDSL